MIISHTVNVNGKRRVYLGAKGSIDTWLEPKDDGKAWRVRCTPDDMHMLTVDDVRQSVMALMEKLAAALGVTAHQLDAVPFDTIARMHSTSTTRDRRIPSPQRDVIETGYMVTPPGVARSKTDFSAPDFNKYHTKGRSRATGKHGC